MSAQKAYKAHDKDGGEPWVLNIILMHGTAEVEIWSKHTCCTCHLEPALLIPHLMSLQASYIACVALFPNNKLKNLQKPTIATLLQNPRLPDTIRKYIPVPCLLKRQRSTFSFLRRSARVVAEKMDQPVVEFSGMAFFGPPKIAQREFFRKRVCLGKKASHASGRSSPALTIIFVMFMLNSR